MPYNYGLCKCCKQQSMRYYVVRLIEEIVEFIECPSLDELGDCMAITSQIAHNITGIVIYLPLSKRSFDKGANRYKLHGCVRSKRNACI